MPFQREIAPIYEDELKKDNSKFLERKTTSSFMTDYLQPSNANFQ